MDQRAVLVAACPDVSAALRGFMHARFLELPSSLVSLLLLFPCHKHKVIRKHQCCSGCT